MPLGVPVSPAPPGSLLSATAVTDTVGGGIVAVSATSPAVLTFAADHGLQTGSTIIVAGTATTPTTVGAFVATVTASNQVSIPVAVASVATGTGTATVKALQQQVGVANFPATQPVSGSVSVSNLPGTQPVSGSVSVSNLPATQPVSGTVGVNNFPATQPVSAASLPLPAGAAQDGTDGGTAPSPVPTGGTGIRGWLASIVKVLQGGIGVTGTFWQATQPVSGTFWQATQPVSGTVTANAGTNMSTAALALEAGNLAAIATNTGKIPALGQAAMAASAPVTIANNQSAVPISAATLPLPAGAATTAKQATLNAAGAATTAPAAARPAGIAHRAGVTAADKLALPGTLTLSAITEAGSTLPNSAMFAAVSAGNIYGVTGPGTIPASVTPTANQAVRMAWAQVAGATYYDLFLSTAAAPLWVARVTEAQRASGGFIVSAVGVVSAGSSAAGSIDIGIQGTGQATSAVPFAANTAYLPANATLVNCAGYSRAHVLADVTLTDARSAPALTIVAMTVGQVGGNWHVAATQAVPLLGAAGQALYQEYELDIDGVTGLVVLIDSIAGQGTACTVNLELA